MKGETMSVIEAMQQAGPIWRVRTRTPDAAPHLRWLECDVVADHQIYSCGVALLPRFGQRVARLSAASCLRDLQQAVLIQPPPEVVAAAQEMAAREVTVATVRFAAS
jgi:hypothetical protein